MTLWKAAALEHQRARGATPMPTELGASKAFGWQLMAAIGRFQPSRLAFHTPDLIPSRRRCAFKTMQRGPGQALIPPRVDAVHRFAMWGSERNCVGPAA